MGRISELERVTGELVGRLDLAEQRIRQLEAAHRMADDPEPGEYDPAAGAFNMLAGDEPW
jgi:hypothetical protein